MPNTFSNLEPTQASIQVVYKFDCLQKLTYMNILKTITHYTFAKLVDFNDSMVVLSLSRLQVKGVGSWSGWQHDKLNRSWSILELPNTK